MGETAGCIRHNPKRSEDRSLVPNNKIATYFPAGSGVQAGNNFHSGAEATPHAAVLRGQEGAVGQVREYTRRYHGRPRHYASDGVRLLFMQSSGHSG